jgi:hypothetical protein
MNTQRQKIALFCLLGLFVTILMALTRVHRLGGAIPAEGITGGTVTRLDDTGNRTTYNLAGIADKSGTILKSNSGEEFWLDGSENLKVTYPTGRVKTFGRYTEQ